MTARINIDDISREDKDFIQDTLVVVTNKNKQLSIFDIVQTKTECWIHLPLFFALRYSPKPFSTVPKDCRGFLGELRPEQIKVRDECIKHLEVDGTCIMGTQPGFGKTITSIEMVCRINVKTMILVKQTVILNQWIKAFSCVAPHLKVQKISGNTAMNPDADVYILNPILMKPGSGSLLRGQLSLCNTVEFLILDEMHLIMTEMLLKSLYNIQPKYLLGLSATPRRPQNDPFKNVIKWFFGPNIVERKLFHPHTVHIVKTNYTPETLKYTPQGLDWNHVLNEQANSLERNCIIVSNVLKHKERIWLILVKRVSHAENLTNLFKERDIETETLVGTKTTFNKKCKILIGTTSKIGVGFDHAPINALCIAADVVEYFEQFLGRCMRVESSQEISQPIVFDFDDDFNILHKHCLHRISEYKKYGGIIIKK